MWKRLIWAESCSLNWSVCWSFVAKSSHWIQDKLQSSREVFLLIISWTSDNISKAFRSTSCGFIWGLFHFSSLFLCLSVPYEPFFYFFSSVSWNFNQLFKSIHSVLYSHLIIHGVSENENIQDRKTTKALSSISTSRSLVKSCSNTKNALKHHQMVY